MKDQVLYDRLMRNRSIDEATGCWNWTGWSHDKRKHPGNRYGALTMWDKVNKKCKHYTTHRAMWIALHGIPPKDKCVCHTCDNPKCFNPDHLWLGTRRENTMDMVKKNRHHLKRKTHCKRGHKLYGDNVYTDSAGYRHCKECGRERQRGYWRTNPEIRQKQREKRKARAASSAYAEAHKPK